MLKASLGTCDQAAGQHDLYRRATHTQLFLSHASLLPLLLLRSVKGCGSYCFQFGFRSVHFNIYLLTAQIHIHICMYILCIYIWLFVHHQDQTCVCVCVYVFYAKSIFNLPAEHLCKYQILTTNTCRLASPKSIPHLICSSAVAFTLNCNYVYVILFAHTQAHTCQHDFHVL